MFKPAATLTVDNASATLAAGLQAIAGGQSVIDLSGVATVDSSAVATLLAWQRAAKQKGLTLQFGVLPTNLQSLVDLYGAASLLGAPTSASDRHH
ncbi:STAS domain-containing protein [Herbaspirillum rhizosphaerae]|uniref:STAS domain-containing protein n=2 Tax=Herbaspirillum rhizosphaerae TaxID=346179 RepID=A0ABW8ZB30_9BURK